MSVNPKIKNLENTQFGRVCAFFGLRSSGPEQPDVGLEPLLDDNGRIIVRIADSGGFVESVKGDFSSEGGYCFFGTPNVFVLSSTNERDIRVNGYSDLPVPAFIQVLRIQIPAAGDIPYITFPVAAGPGAFFKVDVWGPGPTNEYLVISSTQFTYTPIATPCLYAWGTRVSP
jgi:hypothetical protein